MSSFKLFITFFNMSFYKNLVSGTIGAVVIAGGAAYYYTDSTGSTADTVDPSTLLAEVAENSFQLDSVAAEGRIKVTAAETNEIDGDVTIDISGRSTGVESDQLAADYRLDLATELEIGGMPYAGSGTLEARILDEIAYIRISDVELPPLVAMQAGSMVEQFSGQWYSLPASTIDSNNELDPEMLDQIKTIWQEHTFLKPIENLGVKGGAQGMTLGLDTTELVAFLQAISQLESSDTELSAADLAELKSVLDAANPYIELWVDLETRQISTEKLRLTITNPSETQPGKLTIDAALNFSDWNNAAPVSAPVGAVEFDPAALMGGM